MIFILLLCMVLALTVCIYGFKVLPSLESKVIFSCSATLFANYLLLIYLLNDHYFSEWVDHICFFAGQYLLYLFVKSYAEALRSRTPHSYQPKDTASHIKFGSLLASPGLPTYLNEHGIVHVLALPIFYIIQSLVRYKIFELDLSKYEPVIRWLLWGSGTLVLIDVVDFFNEPQSLLNLSKSTIHLIDFGLFIWAFMQFYIVLKKHKDLHNV